jgi:hypothetical protein
MFQCALCEKSYDKIKALRAHSRIHGSQINEALGQHAPDIPKEFQCLECNKTKVIKKNSSGKFCDTNCQQSYLWKEKHIPNIISGAYNVGSHQRTLTRFVKERDGEKCNICGLTEWLGQLIIFDLDHIDGNHGNNLPDNLRLLCPNCHRQTPTWGNQKRKN